MNIIDVSHHDGIIDWAKVITDPFKPVGVYIKATQGSTYVDPIFYSNATGATNAKLQVGYYHFATLNTHDVSTDAKAEATFFVNTIKKAPKATLPLVLDIEVDDKLIKLTSAEVFNYIKTFFYTLEQYSYHDYAIYSYTSYLDSRLPKNHGLGNIKLWIAAYTPKLRLPQGWSKQWLWQYTDSGTIQGISSKVDLSK